MSDLGFNVGETAPSVAFDPLPPGWYAMTIIKAEIAHSDKAGEMLKIEFEIDERAHSEYSGRKAWTNLCHHHEKKQVRDIARSQIAAIAQAIGRPNLGQVGEMLGGELQVKLSVRPAEGQYEARNETKGFRAIGDSTDDAPSAATNAKSASHADAKPARQPWKR